MENNEVRKKITVKNFINWLDGVIDMQEDGWVPDSKQWNKILTKIYEIDDSEPVSHKSNNVPYAQPALPQPPTGHLQQFTPPPPAGTSLPRTPVAMSENIMPSLGNSTGALTSKTPNVDGDYNTPFV